MKKLLLFLLAIQILIACNTTKLNKSCPQAYPKSTSHKNWVDKH